MELPPFPAVTPGTLDEICRRNGIVQHTCVPLPRLGIFNLIYLINDELILRIPRDAPAFTAAIDKESGVTSKILGLWQALLAALQFVSGGAALADWVDPRCGRRSW